MSSNRNAFATTSIGASERLSNSLGVMGLVMLVAVGALAPTFLDGWVLRLFSEALVYLTLAQLWNLLAGYAGLVSVGQQAFVGLGVYAFFFVTAKLDVHPALGFVAAAGVGLVSAAVFSIFIFRLKGPYFAIGTWVMAEICLLTIAVIPELGSGGGVSLQPDVARVFGATRNLREGVIYLMAFGVATLTTAGIYVLLRSRFGLALIAVRDSERAAEALGVDSTRLKRFVYIAVGLVTSLIGSIIFLMKLRMTPDAAFSMFDWTAYALFIVIIGGVGRIEGPIVGTIVFVVLRTLFADYGPVYLVLLGSVSVAAMLFAPRGLWGLFASSTGFELFPIRRRVTRRKSSRQIETQA